MSLLFYFFKICACVSVKKYLSALERVFVGERIPKQFLEHMEKKESTAKWFIFSFIPLLNFWVMWKAAEEVSGHEKVAEKFEFIVHKKPKEPTLQWFGLFFVPTLISILASLLIYFSGAGFLRGMGIALIIAAFLIGVYILWRMAEVVSGHERVYERFELLNHMGKKDSTIKWFLIGIIPIANIYFLWKMAEVIAGHEVVYE